MARFAPLLLVVLALAAAVPAAFADDSTPPAATTATTTTTTAPPAHGHLFARLRLEILRLRLRLVRLEYRVVCHDTAGDRCARFTQKLVDRLTALDDAVQQKLSSLNCASDSTDKRCVLLTRIDAKLKKIVERLQSGAGAPSSSDESGLDSAAATLGGGS